MLQEANGGGITRRKCKVLAFVSAKGGPGKTILTTSLAHILTKTGHRVLLIDTDFITRGASYFIIGDAAESEVLDISPENALHHILRSYPEQGIGDAMPALVSRQEGDEYSVFFADSDLFKGGMVDAELVRKIDTKTLYEGLKALCERFRSKYDYILLDTHGGLDQSSAIPALVADGFVVVLEVDKLSINQTRMFLRSIESYDPSSVEGALDASKRRLEGFISNKWVYPVEDETVLQHLKDLFGGIPFGNIPWDINVVLDYGNKFFTLERHAGSDFAYYAIRVFSKLLGPNLNWGEKERTRFSDLESEHRRKWKLRKAARVGRLTLLSVGIAALALAAAGFVTYLVGHFLATLQLPLSLVLIFLACTGSLAADRTFRALSGKQARLDRQKGIWPRVARWPAAVAVASIFALVGYIVTAVLPVRLDTQGLLKRIENDQTLISTQTDDLIRASADNSALRNQLDLMKANSKTAIDSANLQLAAQAIQVSNLTTQLTQKSNQLEEALKTSTQLANQLSSLKAQSDQQGSELNELRRTSGSSEVLTKQVSDLNEQVISLKSQMAQLSADNSKLSDAVLLAGVYSALNNYKDLFAKASVVGSDACKKLLNTAYPGKLTKEATYCPFVDHFVVNEKCSQQLGGSPQNPTLACAEMIIVDQRPGAPHSLGETNKTFQFARNSDGTWRVSGW